MTIAVVSSVYGGYDLPAAPVAQDVEAEFILVTDQPPADPGPWKVIEEPRPQLHPRLAAKVAKCRPDRYSDAEMTVWVDGHVQITSPSFVRWATTPLQRQRAVLAQLPHPQRRRIADEAHLSARLPKYQGLPALAQVASYLEAGFPDGWGLWATGIIARRTTRDVQAFGDAWLAEQVRWTYQDQLSEAPLLWRAGLRPADLPGTLVGHWAFRLAHHSDGSL